MNNSHKAQLFAKYLGQKVFIINNSYLGKLFEVDCIDAEHGDGYLQLRDISDLSDEEYITLAKIAFGYQWDDYTMRATIVPNHTNIHDDILSVEIMRYIAVPGGERFYKDCHIQIDRVDTDINKYGFRNDGKEVSDEIIDSESAWACLDYLRSISVALPLTVLESGKPITYSVEQMVEMGWVKLEVRK